MSCTTVLQLAQFAPNAVEAEANTVKFGPTNVEGEVVFYSEIQGLDTFFLQQSDAATEAEAQKFADYTDGYAVRLKYHWPISSGDGTYAACLTAVTNQQQSCWAITLASSAISGTKIFYNTGANVANNFDLAGSGTEVTLTCDWYAGFDKTWSISYETDASNHSVIGYRFLPALSGSSSPTDDFRFAPISSENPDQDSTSTVWTYGGTGTGAWTT